MKLNRHLARIFFLFPLLFITGCTNYKYPTECYYVPPPAGEALTYSEIELYDHHQNKALSHWLYRWIPRHRSQIHWYDVGHWLTWGLFGNDDNGIFSETQYPLFNENQNVSASKALAWFFRNPLHNFCFYVIGDAGKKQDEWTLLRINRRHFEFMKYSPEAHTVFAGQYTSFYLGLHSFKPLISLRIAYGYKWKSDFYLGWREKGNFGIKFLPLTKMSLAILKNLNYDDN